jgi:hypothetical protein
MSAAVMAGCDLYRWMEIPEGYTTAFKAKVVAWYRLKSLIEVHSQDAQSQAVEKEMKKNKAKRR